MDPPFEGLPDEAFSHYSSFYMVYAPPGGYGEVINGLRASSDEVSPLDVEAGAALKRLRFRVYAVKEAILDDPERPHYVLFTDAHAVKLVQRDEEWEEGSTVFECHLRITTQVTEKDVECGRLIIRSVSKEGTS